MTAEFIENFPSIRRADFCLLEGVCPSHTSHTSLPSYTKVCVPAHTHTSQQFVPAPLEGVCPSSTSSSKHASSKHAILNDYFDSLAKPLSDHDVTVTEFRADAIMCAWTGDETDVEIRRKPILASLQAADAIEDFKARHDAFETSLRIGLSTGEVYVGHSGGGGHFVYSIVGDCANTASRIEGLNKHVGSQILATDSTIEGIDGLLLRPIGQFVFVGKTEALPILEIMSLASDATDKQAELCERFTRGIELFTACDWKKAAAEFKSILKDYPHDGPSRFYSTHCQQRLKAETLPQNPWVINMAER